MEGRYHEQYYQVKNVNQTGESDGIHLVGCLVGEQIVVETVLVPQVISITVEVTRIVERTTVSEQPASRSNDAPTEEPAALPPEPAPKEDIPGSRDLLIVPRPLYSIIINFDISMGAAITYEYVRTKIT